MRFRHRRGRRRRPIRILSEISLSQILPVPIRDSNPIEISKEEIEVLRLIDYEDKTQEEASVILGCSRAKISRLLNSGRKKLIKALIEGRPIEIV